MKELDFDELDRAVNTLMGGVAPGAPSPSVDDDTTILTIPSTIAGASSPVMPRFTSPGRSTAPQATIATPTPRDTPVEQSDSLVAERPAATESVSTSRLTIPSRRAGRFMDVVHPSSDMKNPSNAPSERPSRTASPITPLTTVAEDAVVVAENAAVEDEVVTAPYPAISEPDTIAEQYADVVVPATAEAASVTPDADKASTDEWPDPLAGFDAASVTQSTATDTEATITPDSPAIDDEDEVGDDDLFTIDSTEPDDEPGPLTSPFLTDAKVEKRPLGVPGDQSSDEPGRAPVLGVLAEETMTTSNPEDQLPPEPTDIAQSLPDELQHDLIAVESDTGSFAAADEPVVAAVAAQPEPTPEASAAPQPAATVSPTSIQPQYKESVATGDQTNGAIYDTKAYHQPLAHPAKKKSGWMWVVWVLLLLVVGAGGAVALYYFGII